MLEAIKQVPEYIPLTNRKCRIVGIQTATKQHTGPGARFRRSPVIDRWKSQKTDCSNPRQDLCPIKIQFWWSYAPLILRCCGQAYCSLPTEIQASDQCKRQTCWQEHPDHRDTMFWPWTVHSQSVLLYLHDQKPNSKCTWLIVRNANFSFSYFVHNHRLYLLLFFFFKSGIILFLQRQDIVSCNNLVSRTLCPIAVSYTHLTLPTKLSV